MNLALVDTNVSDDSGVDRAIATLRAAELAHQAEAAAETAPIHPEVDKMAVHAIEAVAANAAVLRAEARACALRAVAVEMARVGRDPAAWRPEDATAAYSIAETLLDVQSSGGSA